MADLAGTIVALSTPPGESGIAVIRLSGPHAISILCKVFMLPGGRRPVPERMEHRRLYHGNIVGEDGDVVDDVMCAVMKGPDSYTGEDVVEVSSHGNPVITRTIIDLLSANGAREAGPGEFTRRAFLNGKMDLIQAEAVCDLIHARSELQRMVARAQVAGNLSQRINALGDAALSLLGEIEASIDFIEEDIEPLDRMRAVSLLEEHEAGLGELLASASFSRPFREGYHVVITGPVNAGKSSIFNKLLGESRAIVTEIPGTTRDVIREPLAIGGLVFVFHDTAGLRGETEDEIEAIGMGKALEAATSADIVMYVVDATRPKREIPVASIRELKKKSSLILLNKVDLPGTLRVEDLHSELGGYEIQAVSALTGEGMSGIRERLVEIAGSGGVSRVAAERIVLNSRLIRLLEAARERCRKLRGMIAAGEALEILAVAARELLGCYEEATGKRYSEDLLDNIFSRFCIGK